MKRMGGWMVWMMLGAGCAEGVSRGPDAGSMREDSGAPSASDAGGGLSDGGPGEVDGGPGEVDGGTSPTDAGSSPVALVVNEVQAQGDDYVELVNTGALAVALDGLSIADQDGIGTPPADPTHLTALPAGLVLSPGEHFVIAMNVSSPAEGVLTDAAVCRGAARCVAVGYGLSQGAGDAFAVLTSTGEVLLRQDVPGITVTMQTPMESWCRLPDVTGAFGRCAMTPGASNAAP
jgi:hypothetical protein